MGMAGVLDSSRLRYFIARELNVAPGAVEAMTLGSHGDQMVALPRHATVEGKPLPELTDDATLQELFKRTRDAGAEIVGYLKKGSAFYAPSSSAAAMVNAILEDTRDVYPTCAWTTGQYGISDVYLGVPAKLGSWGSGRDRRARSQRRREDPAHGGGRGDPSQVRGTVENPPVI